MPLSSLPALKNSRKVTPWSPLTHFPIHSQMRFRYQKRSLRKHRDSWWNKHVKEPKRETAEGSNRFGTFDNEDQCVRPSREKVLFMDGRINLGVFE